jgi:hypothetical protein
MDQLPSTKGLQVSLTGLLKSSHSLLVVLAVVALSGLGLCLKFSFTFGTYAFCLVLILFIALIVGRFAWRGPEADRTQPSLSLTQQDNRVQAQFVNFDQSAQMIPILQALYSRRPLPAPSGVVNGMSSGAESFTEITPEEGQALANEDARLRRFTFPNLPESKPALGDEVAP